MTYIFSIAIIFATLFVILLSKLFKKKSFANELSGILFANIAAYSIGWVLYMTSKFIFPISILEPIHYYIMVMIIDHNWFFLKKAWKGYVIKAR